MTTSAAATHHPAIQPTARIHPALRATTGLGDAARALLDRRLYAIFQSENDDGTAHLAPVMFLYEDGRLLIETGAATRKGRNVSARPHASVLVPTPEAAWVLGAGTAEVVHGDPAQRLNDRIRAKYLTLAGQQACGDLLAELDDVTIIVHPTRWLSWDLATFMETLAARGVDLETAGEWFCEDDGAGTGGEARD